MRVIQVFDGDGLPDVYDFRQALERVMDRLIKADRRDLARRLCEQPRPTQEAFGALAEFLAGRRGADQDWALAKSDFSTLVNREDWKSWGDGYDLGY